MMLFMLSSLISCTTFTTFIATTPLTIGAAALSTAIIVAMFQSLLMSGWFGLITALIYAGGMMVMFAFFATLQPNQRVGISWMSITLFFTLCTTLYSHATSQPLFNFSLIPVIDIMLMPPQIPLFMSLALFLFLALIAVVKISGANNKGPLRPLYV